MQKYTEAVTMLERPETRSRFLRKLGLGGAGLLGGGALLGSTAGIARAGHGDTIPDVDVLNYALTLEYLEASFYTQALGGPGTGEPSTIGVPAASAKFSRGAITGSKLLAGFGGRIRSGAYGNLIAIRNHEVTHVVALRAAIGGTAVGPCTFNFASALKNVGTFLETAQLLENTGVMAYDGAIRYVDSGGTLQTGAQIATVEARHAAYLNLINRDSPFPFAFDAGKKPSEIFDAAKGFIVSCPPAVTALFGRLP